MEDTWSESVLLLRLPEQHKARLQMKSLNITHSYFFLATEYDATVTYILSIALFFAAFRLPSVLASLIKLNLAYR